VRRALNLMAIRSPRVSRGEATPNDLIYSRPTEATMDGV
jgi:hypothetical protein